MIAEIKSWSEEMYVFIRRIKNVAINDPAPAECRDIPELKLTTVTKTETRNVEKMNDFIKNGIGNLKKIYDVVA